MPITPQWIEQPNYLGYMQAGAGIGLERARMAQRAQELEDARIQREVERNQAIQERQQELAANALNSAKIRRLRQLQLVGENDYRNRKLSQDADENAYKMLLDSAYRSENIDLGRDRLNQDREIAAERTAASLLRQPNRKQTYLIGNTLYEKDSNGEWNPVVEGKPKETKEKTPRLNFNAKGQPSLVGVSVDDPLLSEAAKLDVPTYQTNKVSHWFRPDTEEIITNSSPGVVSSYLQARKNASAGDTNSAASDLLNPKNSLTSFDAGVTNAPVKIETEKFSSESDARSAGHKAGDVVYLIGVGKVRLK